VWWDISTVRFIDPNQDDIVYASRRWGQIFPGSSVDVYQWIVSPVPPANYTGPGIPHDTVSYSINSVLSTNGTFSTQYFFWVRGLTEVATQKGKTLGVNTVAQYIANPRASGIAYIAPINASTTALYNCETLIEAEDTILNIEFDRELTNDNVHVEYELIAQDRADGFLSANLYRKLQDSFCGVDTFGNKVPDPNLRVANLEILSFQNIYAVPLGYRYLVVSDSNNRGLWSIYTVETDPALLGARQLVLTRVQNYNTPDYWSYINWYRPGYNFSIKPVAEVLTYSALSTLTVPVGSSVKVTANAQNKWEIYLLEDTGWSRVGLQDGTIKFAEELWNYALGRFGFDLEVFDAQYFDQEPVIETRKIIQAINEELFVDDLAIERNRALVLMFNFVLSEFSAPEWLVKTSLIDVDHRIHDHGTAEISNDKSDLPASSTVWQEWPYTQWYNNYLLSLSEIVMVNQGTGYQAPPQVTIVGDAATPATGVAVINSVGQVVAVNITDYGSGYQSTPTVVFEGGNGTGARAYARLTNDLVRDFRTVIKYDRFQYQTQVLTWESTGTYENGTLVRYDDRVWRAANSDGSSANVGPTFNLEDWVLVPANELSGVDRTMGYYVAGVNLPGLELPLLIDGVDYPGVQVWGDYFLGTIPVDAQYQSEFTDLTLGETFTSINVNGGEFIGPYEGHAPEELINGSEFDTLDMRVFTRPGSDWQGNGHGFQIGTVRYTYVPAITSILSWEGVVERPVQIIVSNVTAGVDMTSNLDYYVNWNDQTIEIIANATSGDIININVYEVGGGSQLFRANYTTPDQYSWSAPVIQNFVADVDLVANPTLNLTGTLSGTNAPNLVVTKNGVRLRPAASIEWIGDDSSLSFGLPQRTGYSQQIIDAQTDVNVWVNNELQVQSFGAVVGDYSVTNWDGSEVPGRQVVFNAPPASGTQVLIAVTTVTDYVVVGNSVELIVPVNVDDRFTVTSWNDTAQQNLLTLTWVGPVTTGITINEPYDSTDYDTGTVSGGPGTYDYTVGTAIPTNEFDLLRTGITAGRLWVTLNGYRLFEGQDYTVDGQYLILAAGPIETNDIVVATECTDSVVPEAIGFRIFQDMRGVQATYRITPATTTELAQALSTSSDIIYVQNVAALDNPDLTAGILGVVTINGERITYRERNLANNSLTGLLRGTAGTGIASHAVGSAVYDIGRGNLGPESLQDYVISDTSMGDGTTTVFYAPNISIDDFGDSSSIYVESIEVYVGGIRQYNYSDTTATSQYRWICTDAGGDDSPLTIEFVTNNDPIDPLIPPMEGVEVTILTRRGTWWYGVTTQAERELSLQESQTASARFLRGDL